MQLLIIVVVVPQDLHGLPACGLMCSVKKSLALRVLFFWCFLHLVVSKFLSEVLVFSSKGLGDPLRSYHYSVLGMVHIAIIAAVNSKTFSYVY